MILLPDRRRLAACSLLCSLLTLSCGSPNTGPTQPDLPQVTVNVAETNTVGKSVQLSISVSGCTKVQKLDLFDSDTVLKSVSYATTPTLVELTSTEVSFKQGIAANLSLTARVTCDDGRTNVSQAQPATFLPVEEVINPPSESEQVVPNFFVVDGSGDSASFIGCGKGDDGRDYVFRVKKSDPTHYDSLEMTFPCTSDTAITDRKPAGSGARWVWTPGQGAMAIDANFKPLGYYADNPYSVRTLAVIADGSAITSDGTTVQHVLTTGKVQWVAANDDVSNSGNIMGDPIVRTSGATGGTVAVARQEFSLTDNSVNVRVSLFKYLDGTFVKSYKIAQITPQQNVLGVLDSTASVLYLSMQGSDTQATVEACAVGVSTDLCKAGTTPRTRLWISDALLGYAVALVPYNNGSRLAVLTSNRSWFLDSQSASSTAGKVLNKDQQPLTANGALVARFGQPGLNDGSFYVFNAGPGSDAAPLEIMATDSAEKGLLYRYQALDSLYGALDDSGALWLRVGRKLVKPLTPAQYRQLLP